MTGFENSIVVCIKEVARVLRGCALLLVLSGCATGSGGSFSDGGSSEGSGNGYEQAVFRSGVLFSVGVEVGGEKEFESEDFRVRETGDAVLPIIGSVNLSGLTLAEATDVLVGLYKPYYTDIPIVRMQFLMDEGSSPWGYVTVLGRVRKPGRVSLPPTLDMTVSGAIQEADGFDTSANMTAIRITRTGKDHVKTKMTVNINKIGEDGDAGQDVRLRAGDVVFVPERIF